MKRLRNILEHEDKWVILLVGLPLTGKSTFIKNLKINSDFTILSRDNIMLELSGISDYNKAWKIVNQKEVNKLLVDKFRSISKNGDNAIVDMTNLSKKRRRVNLSYFDKYYKISITFDSLSDEEYNKRNNKRMLEENKFISSDIIDNMKKTYKIVSDDEGFDLNIRYNSINH